MFLAGLEVNLKEFARAGSSVFKRVFFYFIILYSLALFMTFYFKLSFVYIVVFPIFSLGMIMALIKDYGKNEPWLNLALVIGIIGHLS